MPTSLQGPTGQNPINQIDQNSTSLVNKSGVKENYPPTFQKALSGLFKGLSLVFRSKNIKRTCTTNSTEGTEGAKSKNFKEGAKAFGTFLLEGIKKHIPEPPILKLAEKFVQHLENIDTSKSFSENISNAFKPLKTALGGFKQKVFQKLGEDAKKHPQMSQIFVKLFKDELLNSDNKTIFNSLPMEAQKAAIVSNRDQIIKNPSVLASADKASVLEVASTLRQTNGTVKEEDKSLMKTLLTAYATVDANIVETQLKLVDKDAMFTPNSNAQPILDRLLSANTDEPNEVSLADKNTLGGIQVIKDLARDSELELKLPSGKTIDISKNFSKRLEGKGDSEKALAIFNEMKKQVSGFDEKDKSAFIDFMCNFATQGFASVYMPNMPSNKIDISGGNYKFFVDYSKQDVNGNSFVEVGVHVNGRAKGQQAILDNSLNLLGVAFPTTNAEIVFTYDKGSLLECNNKASNIEVKHFEQEIGDITFV